MVVQVVWQWETSSGAIRLMVAMVGRGSGHGGQALSSGGRQRYNTATGSPGKHCFGREPIRSSMPEPSVKVGPAASGAQAGQTLSLSLIR